MWKRLSAFGFAAALLAAPAAHAGLDHRVGFDQSGIWNRNVQKGLEYGLVAAELGGALWEGGQTELGRTFWQSIDASAIGAVTIEAMKHVFTRARPTQTSDPNR